MENIDNENIIILQGARQTGKTSIMKIIQKDIEGQNYRTFYINLEYPDILEFLNAHPENIFKIIPDNGKCVVFIDEIQYLDHPTNFLKLLYDEHRDKLKLIATGSSAFYLDAKFEDSLAGRKKIFTIYPLDFKEFLSVKKEQEIIDILGKYPENRFIPLIYLSRIQKYFTEYTLFGGYPRVVLAETIDEKKEILEELTSSYLKKDMQEAGINAKAAFMTLCRILAHQVGKLVNVSELSNALQISAQTIKEFLFILEKSFYIQRIRPWHKNVKKELTKMPKIYFSDTRIRNQLVNNFSGMDLRVDKGELTENIALRQLLNTWQHDDIKYWRTQNKNEVDFIVRENIAYEVKYKPDLINENKYELFRKMYPEINLRFIHFDANIDTKKKSIPAWLL